MIKKLIFYLICLVKIAYIYSKGILDYSHEENSQLFIQAGALSSLKGIIPFSYDKLKICSVEKVQKAEDTLGEILTGEIMFNTAYLVNTNKNSSCQILCLNKQFDDNAIKTHKRLIKRKYFINWYLDKLPAAALNKGDSLKEKKLNYYSGIPLGYENNGEFYIYNHLEFHILINDAQGNLIGGVFNEQDSKKKYDIVGFNIYPMSIKHKKEGMPLCPKKDINSNNIIEPQPLDKSEILFTYDVIFEKSNITMASRWDSYKPVNKKIHWIGIGIAEGTIIIITIIITLIFAGSIRKNIELYNYKIASLEKVEEFSWKELSGDIFRSPQTSPNLLSCMLGTGIQLFFMLAITLFFGTIGFLKPDKRTSLLTLGIALFCIMGLPGGYISARFNKLLGGSNWFKNACLTSLLYPGALVFGYLIVNFILAYEKSSATVGILDIISLFVLWTFCTFPLILIGSFFGIKRRIISIPCKINIVPTVIPKKPFYLRYRFIAIFTGIICFGTVFVEIYYVMGALWKHQIYFIATFLWLTVLIMVLVSGELSIFTVYLNICKGDYNWWWKSFGIGGSPVFYFVAYSIYYFFSLKIRTIPAIVVYFGITGLIGSMFLLVCGSVSTIMTFWFLRIIYSKIRFV